MGGKSSNNSGYNALQGGRGAIIADPTPPTATSVSGATEPVWPTSPGATIPDGGVSGPPVITVIIETALTNSNFIIRGIDTTHLTVGMRVSCGGLYYPANTVIQSIGTFGSGSIVTSNPPTLPTEFVGPVFLTFQSGGGGTGAIIWTAIPARQSLPGTVTAILNEATFNHDLGLYPSHYFQYGTVTWLTGDNAGFTCDVRDSLASVRGSQPYVYMLEIAPNPIQVGDTFTALVGCSKIRSKCQAFNNLDNHRAFPDMPTEERALATPNISNQGFSPNSSSSK
jgi:hypothetical protein